MSPEDAVQDDVQQTGEHIGQDQDTLSVGRVRDMTRAAMDVAVHWTLDRLGVDSTQAPVVPLPLGRQPRARTDSIDSRQSSQRRNDNILWKRRKPLTNTDPQFNGDPTKFYY